MCRATSAAGVLLLAMGMLACQRGTLVLAGSRHTSIRGSSLVTEFRQGPRGGAKVALAHVLFVPERDVPLGGGFGGGTSSSGTADIRELDFQYSEMESNFSIQSRPVTIFKADAVEAGGRTFQLVRANLFIALVRLDGSVELIQLPHVLQDPDTSAKTILGIMKAAVPLNERIEALDLR